MDTDALIGKVITRSHAIEKLLQKHYSSGKGGLFASLKSLGDQLPAILSRTIRVIASIRNAAAHPDGFSAGTVPADFDRLCDETEVLIPFFANRRGVKVGEPRSEAKPLPVQPAGNDDTPTAKRNDAGAKASPKQGRPWTREEDELLIAGFDARKTIPELVAELQRGFGGIQRRLTKLGKMNAEDYQVFPPSPL